MRTEPREKKEQAKPSLRDVFIVAGEVPTPETEHLTTANWQDARDVFVGITTAGLVIFGLHYLAFGQAQGEPSRSTMITGFTTVASMLGFRMKAWPMRVRFLTALASAMAIVGLFLRFVVQDKHAFSPDFIAFFVVTLALLWLGFDAYERWKAKRPAET